MSFVTFMNKAHEGLAVYGTPAQRPLTLVLGNESADIDSLCSAIVLAYLQSFLHPETVFIPVSNIPREDVVLRPELSIILHRAGLSPDDLITISDLPTGTRALKPEDTQWVLVDHNVPTGIFRELCKSIVGCVDHHLDENYVPTDVSPRFIYKAGSCLSMIVHHLRDDWLRLATEDECFDELAAIQMARGVVLADTHNLSEKTKTTPVDIAGLEFLEERLQKRRPAPLSAESANQDREVYLKEILDAMSNMTPFTLHQILRKDYKLFIEDSVRLGTCAAVRNLEYLLGKAGGTKAEFLQVLRTFATERNLDVVTMHTMTRDSANKTHKEFLLFGVTPKGVRIAKTFENNFAGKLELKPWNNGLLDIMPGCCGAKNGWLRAWNQGAVQYSRKQLAPFLRETARALL